MSLPSRPPSPATRSTAGPFPWHIPRLAESPRVERAGAQQDTQAGGCNPPVANTSELSTSDPHEHAPAASMLQRPGAGVSPCTGGLGGVPPQEKNFLLFDSAPRGRRRLSLLSGSDRRNLRSLPASSTQRFLCSPRIDRAAGAPPQANKAVRDKPSQTVVGSSTTVGYSAPWSGDGETQHAASY